METKQIKKQQTFER
uniref:Uncharacterized protein n=1 Tax=Arundo donax TaxID=35708 RepID=A0A0A8XXG5_ARUDO